MTELFIGQILAIFILIIGMTHMVGGKGLSAKVARLPLKLIRRLINGLGKLLTSLLEFAWKQFTAFIRWGWTRITS